MKIDLKGKKALITGGARGIGAAIASDLIQCGAEVLLVDREVQALDETVAKLIAGGGKAIGLSLDITNAQEAVARLAEANEKTGPYLLLVHNAGITRDNLLMRMSAEEWDLVMKVNLYPLFHLTKELLKPMMRERYGRIVAVSSVTGLMGNAGQTNYASAKAAVTGFVKSLARELGSRNITVNAVAPGFIKTPMTEKLQGEPIERLKEAIALRRLGEAEDVAHAVTFLLSDQAAYITGHVLNVSGGLYM
jgi:3-oxoacyl-[acyl-carrier protein] reductase